MAEEAKAAKKEVKQFRHRETTAVSEITPNESVGNVTQRRNRQAQNQVQLQSNQHQHQPDSSQHQVHHQHQQNSTEQRFNQQHQQHPADQQFHQQHQQVHQLYQPPHPPQYSINSNQPRQAPQQPNHLWQPSQQSNHMWKDINYPTSQQAVSWSYMQQYVDAQVHNALNPYRHRGSGGAWPIVPQQVGFPAVSQRMHQPGVEPSSMHLRIPHPAISPYGGTRMDSSNPMRSRRGRYYTSPSPTLLSYGGHVEEWLSEDVEEF